MDTNIPQEFLYLNKLRRLHHDMDMFCAHQYIEAEFSLRQSEARIILADWMRWVSETKGNIDL